MKRAAIVAGAIVLGAALVIVAGAAASADAPKKPEPLHFSHAMHAQRLDVKKCELCHGIDDKGQVTPPAAFGHSPCLSAACHATWFLATGETGKKKDPKLYARAAQFCQGCHDSTDGSPPAAWTKPSPGAALRSFQQEREFHVEMPHFRHTQMEIKDGGKDRPAACRDCHKVDDKTLALIPAAPGHAQCVQCHNASNKATHSMRSCASCHSSPARAEYFPKPSRKKTKVRACDGEGHAQLADNHKDKTVPCFKHERDEHRKRADGTQVQCGDCHAMVSKQSWNTHNYETLKDLHFSPIIDNNKDLEHKSCGRNASCHANDVDDSKGTGKCAKCHVDLNTDTF